MSGHLPTIMPFLFTFKGKHENWVMHIISTCLRSSTGGGG